MAVLGVFTNQGLSKVIQAAANEGWYLKPSSFSVSSTAGALDPARTTKNTTWFSALVSGVTVLSQNAIEVELTIPASQTASPTYIEEIYLDAKDMFDVEFLLCIGQPDTPVLYDPTDVTTFRLTLRLANIDLSSVLQFTFTLAQDVAQHNIDPNAHPVLQAAMIKAGIYTHESEHEYRGQFWDEFPKFDGGVQEITEVTCPADSSGSLNNKYWTFSSPYLSGIDYYVWYNVNAAGTDPAVPGRSGIEVELDADDDANTVATKTAAAIDAVFDLQATPSANVVTLTNVYEGAVTDAANVDAGVSINVTQQGFNPTVSDYEVVYMDLDEKYKPALADGTIKSRVAGIAVISESRVITSGLVYIGHSETIGTRLYLSSTTPGAITNVSTSIQVGVALRDGIMVLQPSLSASANASGISAADGTHTYVLGSDVQAQLDAADAVFVDQADDTDPAKGATLIGLKVATPADWTVEPSDPKAALDELADRITTDETNLSDFVSFITDDTDPAKGSALVGLKVATSTDWDVEPNTAKEGLDSLAYRTKQNKNYMGFNFLNHVIAADHDEGAGNIDLNSTVVTNPYDLKFSDLKIVPHSERVEIVELQRIPGARDSLGRPQFYAVTTRGVDKRIRFTGTWEIVSNSTGRFVGTNITNDYFEVTGVLTGLIGMLFVGAGQSTGVDTDVDNVDQGADINLTTFASTLQANYQRPNTKFILASGKTLDIHNVKVTNLGGGEFNVYGVELLNESSKATSLPGNGFIDSIKREISSKEDMTLPTPTGTKGGRLVVYRDPDGLLQTALREPTNASTTGGNGTSGQPNLGVVDTTGFLAGDMIRISEGVLSEYIMVSAIGLGTLICSSNLVNSYSNADVEMTARGTINADHSNEEPYEIHWSHFKFGLLADTWSGLGTAASDRIGTLDDGLTNLVGEDVLQVNQYANPAAIGDYLEFTFYGTGADIIQNRTATDPDATYDIYLNNTLMLSGYNFACGEVLKLFSDGKFKTNVIRIYRVTTGAVSSSIFLGIVCYQTSKPTFNGLELASGNITSNYLANPVRNSDDGTVRHHLSYSEPVLFGANWSKVKNTAYPGGAYLLNVGPGTVDYIDFTFMGKGITFYNSQLAGRIAIVNVLIKDTDGVFRAPSALTGFSLTYSDGDSFSQAGAIDTKLRWIGFPENMVNTIRFQRGANGDFLISVVDVHQSMYGVEFGQNAMYGHVAIGSTYLKDERGFGAIKEDEKFLCSNRSLTSFTTTSTTPIPIHEMTTPFYMDRDGYVEISVSFRMFNSAATSNTRGSIVLDGIVIDSLDTLNDQNYPIIVSRSYYPVFLSKGYHTVSLYAAVTAGTGAFTGSQVHVKKA